jgi:hypothetical protein
MCCVHACRRKEDSCIGGMDWRLEWRCSKYLYEDYYGPFLLRKGCTSVFPVSRRAVQLKRSSSTFDHVGVTWSKHYALRHESTSFRTLEAFPFHPEVVYDRRIPAEHALCARRFVHQAIPPPFGSQCHSGKRAGYNVMLRIGR